MNLADVMDELAARIETISGLQVFSFPPDHVSPPTAVVTYPETYTYDETYGRGSDRLTVPVLVMVGKASDRASKDQLAAYADGSGLKSIKAVIEGDGASYLDLPGGSGNYAQTPEHPTLDIAGNLWLAADVALDDWTPAAINTLIAKWLPTFGLKGYLLDVTTAGEPRAGISSTGANDILATGTALGFTNATRHAVGVEIVPNDGAGNRTFQFYTAPTLAGPWAPHGSLITQAGAVSIFNTNQPLVVGASNSGSANVAAGNFYGAEVRNGDRNGAIVANPDFTAQTPGAHAFIDSKGLPWIMEGTAAIVADPLAPYTAFDSARVQSAEFDVVSMAGVEHVAARFNIDVIGEGS